MGKLVMGNIQGQFGITASALTDLATIKDSTGCSFLFLIEIISIKLKHF